MRIHTLCADCGAPEDEHHQFVPVFIPDGCRCDPMDWTDPLKIPKTCRAWTPDDDGLCGGCSHEQGCHS